MLNGLLLAHADLLDDGAAELDGIDLTGVAVDDLSITIEQDGVGQRALPLTVKGFGECVGFAGENVVISRESLVLEGFGILWGERGVLLGEEFERRLALLLRIVHGDGDEGKTAALVAAVGIDEGGELREAGSAIGRPDINQAEVASIVCAELIDDVDVRVLESDGQLSPLGAALLRELAFPRPFRRATENAGLGGGDLFPCEDLI